MDALWPEPRRRRGGCQPPQGDALRPPGAGARAHPRAGRGRHARCRDVVGRRRRLRSRSRVPATRRPRSISIAASSCPEDRFEPWTDEVRDRLRSTWHGLLLQVAEERERRGRSRWRLDPSRETRVKRPAPRRWRPGADASPRTRRGSPHGPAPVSPARGEPPGGARRSTPANRFGPPRDDPCRAVSGRVGIAALPELRRRPRSNGSTPVGGATSCSGGAEARDGPLGGTGRPHRRSGARARTADGVDRARRRGPRGMGGERRPASRRFCRRGLRRPEGRTRTTPLARSGLDSRSSSELHFRLMRASRPARSSPRSAERSGPRTVAGDVVVVAGRLARGRGDRGGARGGPHPTSRGRGLPLRRRWNAPGRPRPLRSASPARGGACPTGAPARRATAHRPRVGAPRGSRSLRRDRPDPAASPRRPGRAGRSRQVAPRRGGRGRATRPASGRQGHARALPVGWARIRLLATRGDPAPRLRHLA